MLKAVKVMQPNLDKEVKLFFRSLVILGVCAFVLAVAFYTGTLFLSVTTSLTESLLPF